MFKNMKLSSKLYLGFGVLVVIAGVLGFVGYNGVNSIKAQMDNQMTWSEVDASMVENLTQPLLHLDMAIDEFRAYKTSESEKGIFEAYDHAMEGVKEWKETPLVAENRELIEITSRSEKVMEEYNSMIKEYTGATSKGHEIREEWDSIISECLVALETTMIDVIDPAKDAALESRDIEEIGKWGDIDMVMNEQVIANVLKLQTASHDYASAPNEESWKEFGRARETAFKGLEEWRGTLAGEAKMEIAAGTIEGYLQKYSDLGNKFADGVKKTEAIDIGLASTFDEFDSYLDGTMINVIDPALEKAQSDANSAQQQAVILAMVFAISGIIIGIALAFFITRSITKPVNRIIDGLTEGASQVGSASEQVAAASQSLAEGSSEQASSIEETSSSLEEMASMTKQNADNSAQANTLSNEATEAAERGSSAVSKMSSAMQEIKKSSDETAKIIKVIDEIAFQTNLLALNAAVEAARAGDAGKGFAVVAEEVRNLAQRSAEAAKDTNALIEGSQKNADDGVRATEEVVEILGNVTAGIKKVSGLLAEVAAASKEQAQGVDQVNQAVSQMDQVTQTTAANAEESSSASEELAAQAQEMQKIVDELNSLVKGSSQRIDMRASSTSVRKQNSEPASFKKGLKKLGNPKKKATGSNSKKDDNSWEMNDEVRELEESEMSGF